MYLLGLTGPMAGGKSTVADMLKKCGAALTCADAIVHELQQPDTPETQAIKEKIGIHILDDTGAVDRKKLSADIKTNPQHLFFLENILHPAVQRQTKTYLQQYEKDGYALVVLEIPLLYQTHAEQRCDSVAVCVCNEATRKSRAFERPYMTEEKWALMNSRQLDEEELSQRADHIIRTDTSLAETQHQVQALYEKLVHTPGNAWPDTWQKI